jgi:hypothetical protein
MSGACMNSSVSAVCEGMGYPIRGSLLTSIFPRNPTQTPVMRLNDAISVLFQVSDELYTTRQAANATGKKGHLKPLLLFDNVHDLITVQLLIAAGGKAIFHQLWYHLDHYCAEDASIQAVLGTNTADVIMEIYELQPHLKPWE